MPLSGKDLVRLLVADGWLLKRINGSHFILERNGAVAVVPVHGNKSLGKGLEAKLLKQTGLRKR